MTNPDGMSTREERASDEWKAFARTSGWSRWDYFMAGVRYGRATPLPPGPRPVEDLGYGVVTCRGCYQRVPLYVMGAMVAHQDPHTRTRCGHSHSTAFTA